MLGRLSVSYYTDLGDASKPLNQIADRTYVSATGTVSHVTATAIVLTGTDGNTAHCTISADTRQNFAANLIVGTQVMARGLVRHLPDGQRVIDATAVHNLDRRVVLS
jgi:hypothetical protein